MYAEKKDRESIWRQNHRLLITFSKLLCGKRPGWVKIKNNKKKKSKKRDAQ